jgi:hypothetical protein
MTTLATRGTALAAAALGLLRSSPAFACGGACATDSLAALPFLAGVAALVVLTWRVAAFARTRSLARTLSRAHRE